MSDVGTGIFAKERVVPEDVVALSVFPFATAQSRKNTTSTNGKTPQP